ncbi:MAG: hypothetical protein J6X55_04390 [Victivallales bacterium]|nr:hypothetical protein [Victivallales bacterium]
MVDMSKDDFLGLLQAISEGICIGIKNFRAAQGCIAAGETAVASASTPAVAEKAEEKKEEPLTVLQMTSKILKRSSVPLGKDDIIAIAKERFGADINKATLSVALNHALKKHKAIKRVSHGRYTNIGRKMDASEGKNA